MTEEYYVIVKESISGLVQGIKFGSQDESIQWFAKIKEDWSKDPKLASSHLDILYEGKDRAQAERIGKEAAGVSHENLMDRYFRSTGMDNWRKLTIAGGESDSEYESRMVQKRRREYFEDRALQVAPEKVHRSKVLDFWPILEKYVLS